MELQAIREKLQRLRAEQPAAEAQPLPWSLPLSQVQRASPMTGEVLAPSASAKQADTRSPQAIAIETLKQRSRGHDLAANARIDNLVSQELYRLEVQANTINERSQQQAADIMALKRSAQQASVGLRRQGIHDHPQLAAITQFLEQYTSAVVPHIERDGSGYFALSYDTIDFQRAQQDAIDMARVLRDRQRSPRQQSFSQPVTPIAPAPAPASKREFSKKQAGFNHSFAASSNQIKTAIGGTLNEINQRFKATKRKRRQRKTIATGSFALDTGAFADEGWKEGVMVSSTTSEFTWIDGTIWFSGAAIARIALQSVVAGHPVIDTALMIGLAAAILFALYRIVVVKASDYTLIYRLCIGLIGLFLAGMF